MTKIDRHNAAKILGWNYRKVLRWLKSGKIKSAVRSSKASQAPWLCDKEEIMEIKNASDTR